MPGVVVSKSGPLSYTIDAEGQKHRRHIDRLKKRVRRESNGDDNVDDEFMPGMSELTNPLEPESDTRSDSEEPIPDTTVADTRSQVPGQGAQPSSRRYQLRANRNATDRFGH
jgi:hypothetical protein